MSYERPIIIEQNDMFEGIYALDSGEIPAWDWSVWWANHNSGSHSEMEIRGTNKGNNPGSYIMVTISFFGKGEILNVAPASKASETRWGKNYITVIYYGIFNPGESVVFGLPSITFSDPAEGEETQGSYHTSGGPYCNCEAGDAFAITSWQCE